MLVLRPGALGDTLLAVPALRVLRRVTREPIRLAAHGGAAKLLEQVGEVDEGFAFDDPRLAWLFGPPRAPRSEPVVAWLDRTLVPGLIAPCVLAPSRPPRMDRHVAQYLVETLAPLGAGAELDQRGLTIAPLEIDQRPLIIAPFELNEVLVHPGSGSPTKNWPAERFAAVIRALDGVPARLVVGEADVAQANAIDACLGRRVPRLSHPGLMELAQRLAGCRAYLGNDSGVSHLAGLSGARTIALFGPSSALVWRPLGPRVTVMDFASDPERVALQLR